MLQDQQQLSQDQLHQVNTYYLNNYYNCIIIDSVTRSTKAQSRPATSSEYILLVNK